MSGKSGMRRIVDLFRRTPLHTQWLFGNSRDVIAQLYQTIGAENAGAAQRSEAAKVAREAVMLMGSGPIGSTGQLNTPGPREVFALWPTLIPREEVTQTVTIKEMGA